MWKIFTYTGKLLSDSLVKQVTEQHLQEERLFYKMSRINFQIILKHFKIKYFKFLVMFIHLLGYFSYSLSPRQLKNNDSF